MIEPGPLLFSIVFIIVMLVPAMVIVAAAWLLARKVGPRWPARLSSPKSITLLSLAPTALDIVCLVLVLVFARASIGGQAGPLAVIVAGGLGSGWALFLLFLTGHLGVTSQSSLLGLRIWLVICLMAGALVMVLGFGLGVSQGIH